MSIIMGSSSLMIVFVIILIVPILMVLDFFGVNITDDYVEGNMQYADQYILSLNNNISSGYVSLNRILYFSISSQMTFDQIYKDNVDTNLKQVIPISDVCLKQSYKILDVCKNIDSNQIDEVQSKPFAKPVDFEDMTITSFFMQERIVYEEYNIHYGWDFALPAESPTYAVCDGTIIGKNFPYTENTIDKEGGGGNTLTLECDIGGVIYNIIYAHLYPNSALYNIGDTVFKGDTIASIGTTGYSTGNHLHFEVRQNNVLIDSMSLIDFNFVKEDIDINTKPEYGY